MDVFVGFSPRILFIENNENVADNLLRCFEKEGYIVRWSSDSIEVQSVLAEFLPNLIILNWNALGTRALDLCQNIRHNSNFNEIKIIVISDEFNENDAIRALTMGADDYAAQPISNPLLLTKAWAQLRPLRNKSLFASGRSVKRRAASTNLFLNKTSSKQSFNHNGITVNIETREVKRHDTLIKLREAEFRLLLLLIENPKKIFTRNEIIYDLWEQPDQIDFRTIDVMIGRLRKALSVPNRSDAIRSVRGLGYGLAIEDPLIKA